MLHIRMKNLRPMCSPSCEELLHEVHLPMCHVRGPLWPEESHQRLYHFLLCIIQILANLPPIRQVLGAKARQDGDMLFNKSLSLSKDVHDLFAPLFSRMRSEETNSEFNNRKVTPKSSSTFCLRPSLPTGTSRARSLGCIFRVVCINGMHEALSGEVRISTQENLNLRRKMKSIRERRTCTHNTLNTQVLLRSENSSFRTSETPPLL